MILEYTLSENDLLTYQLYEVSISPRIRKKRWRTRVIFPVIWILLVLIDLVLSKQLPWVILLIALVWYWVYPIWESKYYIKHYRNHIREKLKGKIDEPISIQFYEDYLFTKDKSGETKLWLSEVERIIELPSIILINLTTEGAIIIPKQQIADVGLLRSKLQEITQQQSTEYIINDQWKWH